MQQGSGGYEQFFFGIGANIRIGREMLSLPYAGFLQTSEMSKIFSTKNV